MSCMAATLAFASTTYASKANDRAIRMIEDRYWNDSALRQRLGDAEGGVFTTPRRQGAGQHFANGQSLYVSAGWDRAFHIHGAIREHWANLGWEESPYGFPRSDELDAPECGRGGRRTNFEGGHICWTPERGTWDNFKPNLILVSMKPSGNGVDLTVDNGGTTQYLERVLCWTAKWTSETSGIGDAQREVNVHKFMEPHTWHIYHVEIPRGNSDYVKCYVYGLYGDTARGVGAVSLGYNYRNGEMGPNVSDFN